MDKHPLKNKRDIKIGIVGDKIVNGESLLVGLLKQNKIEVKAIRIAKQIFLPWPKKIELLRCYSLEDIKQCDIIQAVFPFHTYGAIIIAKILGKKVIAHWIGTDVWYLLGKPLENLKRGEFNRFLYQVFYKFLGRMVDFHLCGSASLQDELASLGIKAAIVPIPPLGKTKILPLPKEPTIYSYIPQGRHEFYGSKILLRLAKECKQIKFMSSGGWLGEKLPNIKYFPQDVDMREIYPQTTIVLRFPEHDGMSLMVLEGLLWGRQVIWNHKFPHCFYAETYDQTKAAVKEITKHPQVNYDGVQYVKKNFNKQQTAKKLFKIYLSLLK